MSSGSKVYMCMWKKKTNNLLTLFWIPWFSKGSRKLSKFGICLLVSEPEDLPALVDPESSDTSRDNSDDEGVPDLVDLESSEDSDVSDNNDKTEVKNYLKVLLFVLIFHSWLQHLSFIVIELET